MFGKHLNHCNNSSVKTAINRNNIRCIKNHSSLFLIGLGQGISSFSSSNIYEDFFFFKTLSVLLLQENKISLKFRYNFNVLQSIICHLISGFPLKSLEKINLRALERSIWL